MSIPRALIAFLLLVTSGCAVSPDVVPAGRVCASGVFAVEDGFAGARRGACAVSAPDAVTLYIEPEDDAVRNPSPWFAFRVLPVAAGDVTITLDYGDWKHRYVPKVSADGHTWERVADDRLSRSEDGHQLRIRLTLDRQPLYVSAQALFTPERYEAWSRRMAERSVAHLDVVGESIRGLPIYRLDSAPAGDNAPANVLLITGRQHPPEISGAFAFSSFAETVFGDSELARSFRRRFRIVALPLMNPDGVVAGHWRHNLGETDLNRDWGPFEQPETKVIKSLLDKLDAQGSRVRMFIDFHSTRRNVFYTQSEPTRPAGFSAEWLARAGARLPLYEFENAPRATSSTANAKNYLYKRYGIPSLTYEVADETDRAAARNAARILAEELMRLWLQRLAADAEIDQHMD